MNEFEKQLANQPLKSVPTEWRAQILNEAKAHEPRDIRASEAWPFGWLRELLWPCPQAWGALAAVWIVIAAFKFITPGATLANADQIAKSKLISVPDQRRELANLLGTAPDKSNHSPADRPRSARVIPQTLA
jgi:hypothetical protein